MDFSSTISGLWRPGKYLFRLLQLYMLAASFLLVGSFDSFALEAGNEYSVKARRASHSLLLDCISVNSLAVAVGERGHILTSRDSGKSWNQANVPTRTTFTGVFFHNQNLGWVVGHDAEILRTDNGGQSWLPLYRNPKDERPLFDIWFKDAEHGVAIGGYGLYLETSDGGYTWNEGVFKPQFFTSSPDVSDAPEEGYEEVWDFHLNQIIRSKNGHLYIAAEAGNIFRSDDEGLTWMAMPSPYNGSFFGCLPLQGDVVLIFGLRGHLFRSEDAGETWKQIKIETQASLTSGLRLDSGHIVLTGLSGTLLVSDDEGLSFTLKQQPNRKNILKAVKTDDGGFILVGAFGVKKFNLDDLGLDQSTIQPVRGK